MSLNDFSSQLSSFSTSPWIISFLHILSQNLITQYLNLCSLLFFFLKPHCSSPGSCPLLFFKLFFFLTLSGLVSCVTGKVTVSGFFLCKPLLLLLLLFFLSFLLPSLLLHYNSLSFYYFTLVSFIPSLVPSSSCSRHSISVSSLQSSTASYLCCATLHPEITEHVFRSLVSTFFQQEKLHTHSFQCS